MGHDHARLGAHLGDHPSQGVQRLDAVVYDEDLSAASHFLMDRLGQNVLAKRDAATFLFSSPNTGNFNTMPSNW